MSYVWNYLRICPCFKTRFLDNWVIAKWNLKKKKIVELEFLLYNLSSLKIFKWNSSSTIIIFFLISFCYNLIVKKMSFTLKLDFLKIKFQNRNTSLNNFKQRTFYWKVCKKWVKPHFGHHASSIWNLLFVALKLL